MNTVKKAAWLVGVPMGALAVLASAYMAVLFVMSIPGLRRLPKESRRSLDGVVTVEDAAEACRRTGLQSWDLVEYAQKLAARKFEYSRRNGWDSPARAFERGMGYCQQQALALKLIYHRLGIESWPVFAVRCRFGPSIIHGMPEPGIVSGHTWLRVRIGDDVRDVCPGSESNRPGVIDFEILSTVRRLPAWLQPVAHWGSVMANILRDREALRRSTAHTGELLRV